MHRLFCLLSFLIPLGNVFSQETIINVSFSQPRELAINAGQDVDLSGDSVVLGDDLSISGGTPDFAFKWVSDKNEEFHTQVITIHRAGLYVLTVTDARKCSDMDTVMVISTRLDDAPQDAACLVYPNPAGDLVWVQAQNDERVLSVEGFSVKGEKLFKVNADENAGQNLMKIRIADLAPGVIHLRIRTTASEVVRTLVKK
jgi:Secretion system C-terminal sorting domain